MHISLKIASASMHIVSDLAFNRSHLNIYSYVVLRRWGTILDLIASCPPTHTLSKEKSKEVTGTVIIIKEYIIS